MARCGTNVATRPALLLLAMATAACGSGAAVQAGPPLVQPGAPGEATRPISVEEAVPPANPPTQADVDFMQGMIHHHAQALAMTALLFERTESREMRLLARRIELSQIDEIALMQDWLRARGREAPEPDMEQMHHMMGGEHEFMPGMLTHEQMAELEAAEGSEFDRLFLEYMILHHDGALIMVRELFATAGAAQDDDLFTFASHVEADQTIEIRRMRAMLARPGPPGGGAL